MKKQGKKCESLELSVAQIRRGIWGDEACGFMKRVTEAVKIYEAGNEWSGFTSDDICWGRMYGCSFYLTVTTPEFRNVWVFVLFNCHYSWTSEFAHSVRMFILFNLTIPEFLRSPRVHWCLFYWTWTTPELLGLPRVYGRSF